MRTRILTYDKKTGNDYQSLYDWFTEVRAKKLTESTYQIESNLGKEEFISKVSSFMQKGDNFWFVSVDDKTKGIFAEKIKKEN